MNSIYKGLVKRITDYGIFVELFPGTEGLCHISEISNNKQLRIKDIVNVGDHIQVMVINIDKEGRIKLSHKRVKDQN